MLQQWIPYGLGSEPMHRKAVHVDRPFRIQEGFEVVPVATTAHLCVVEVFFTHVITAEHPIGCLRSDVQPLFAAKSAQVSTCGDGHVSPFVADRTLWRMAVVLNDREIKESPRLVVVGSAGHDTNQREVALEILREGGKRIVVE